MSNTPTLNSYWQYYQQCAADAEKNSADAFSAGREEQVCEVLRAASPGMFVLTDAERDRLDRLPWNRSKKHIRQQRRLMAALGRVVKGSVVHTHQVMLDDEISRVRTKLTSEEWDVEWRLANGQTFDDVAEALRVKPEVLRKRASRWRSRVRSQVR